MSFNRLLNTTCTIQALTKGYDSISGQETETWANSAASVKCRLDQAKGGEVRSATSIYEKATHILFMKNRTISEETNRIVIGSETFNILLVSDASGHGRHLELLLERIGE